MGNSMSILICGDEKVANRLIAKVLCAHDYEICGDEKVRNRLFGKALHDEEISEEISEDEYKFKVALKNNVLMESTLYVKNDLKDRKTEKLGESYYSRKFDKINGAVFVFDFSKESSFELLKAIIEDFKVSRPGFGVAIIGNYYAENEKQNVKLNDALDLANQHQLDYYNFHDINKLEPKETFRIMKKDLEDIKGIFEKVYEKMPKKKGCCF